MAVVLVIIGLILGMAFKGRDLLEGAKVKNMAAQYNKVATAFNVYYERYGVFPGDGCTAEPAPNVTQCTGVRNGTIDSSAEAGAALTLLQNTQMLARADLQNAAGSDWRVISAPAGTAHLLANATYLVAGGTDGQVDLRYVCALDRQLDDGNPASGSVRSAATAGDEVQQYNQAADCWSKSGTSSLAIRLI